MKKFVMTSVGFVAFVGGLAGVYAVACSVPIGSLDYQPAAWGGLILSFIGIGTFTKANI